MSRHNDEFNVEKITNERVDTFEFGGTQDGEYTSFSENRDPLRDEVNDNPQVNDDHSPEEKERKKEESKKEESKQSNSSSSSSGEGVGGSAATSIATVVGASLVTVGSLSALVGIDLFYNGKCTVNNIEPAIASLKYDVDIEETGDDNIIIKLENPNKEYHETQNLMIGNNVGEFINLTPATSYSLAVVDTTYNNFVLHEEIVTTLDGLSYTVSFETNGGTPVESQLVPEGGYVTEPADPYKENYQFVGWYLDNEMLDKYDFATPVHNDFVLYAGWIDDSMAVVSFDANGGSGTMDDQYVEKGGTILLPVCSFLPPLDNQVFNRWRMGSTTGTSYTEGAEVTINEDIVFYATYKDDDRYVIEFDANGGTGTMDPLITQSYSPTVPESEFEAPDGFKFDHWSMDGNEYYPGEQVNLPQKTGNTLVANWLPEAELEFHIKYIEIERLSDRDGDTMTLHFSYKFLNNRSMYLTNKFEFILEAPNGDKLTLDNLEIPAGVEDYQPFTVEITTREDYPEFISNASAFNYFINGTIEQGGEEVVVSPIKGSFSKYDVLIQSFNDVFIGGTRLTDNCTVPYFLNGSGTGVIALQLDYSDPLEEYGTFKYDYMTSSGGGAGGYLVTTRGYQLVTIDYSADTMVYNSFTISHGDNNELRSYLNVTFEKTQDVGIVGFEIDESELKALDNNISEFKVKMAGNGYNNGTTIGDLSGERFRFILEPQGAGGSIGKSITISFTPDSLIGIGDQFSIEVPSEKQEVVSKYFRNYAMSVRLIYYDSTAKTSVLASSYVKHTFTYK